MDVDQLQESIRNFRLDDGPRGDQGYSRVLLQIFGYLGHGKSSFINSCKYVVDDGEDFRAHAEAAGTNEPKTLDRKAYDLTRNITIVDNRGCPIMNSFQRAEIYAQLGNFLPIGETVEWMKDYTDMMTRLEDAERNPNYSDFIVPIFIYSAITPPTSDIREAVKEFMTNCKKMTGVVPIVVITKKNSANFMKIEKEFKLMGAENIISIENYTEEDHIKTRGKTNDILMVIYRALEDVKYRLKVKERNPQEDWRERKKFMLDYIHNADLEKKEKERRIEEVRRKMEERRAEEIGREEEKRRAEERRREEERRKEEVRRRREEAKNPWEDWRELKEFSLLHTYYVDLEKEHEMRRTEQRRGEEEERRAVERNFGRYSLEMDNRLSELRLKEELEKIEDDLRAEAKRKENGQQGGGVCLIQ